MGKAPNKQKGAKGGESASRGCKPKKSGAKAEKRMGNSFKGRGAEAPASLRKQTRAESREAIEREKGRGQKRKHNGAEAMTECRERMKVKLLTRQLAKESADKPAEERRDMHLELAWLQLGRSVKDAPENFRAALKLAPCDEDFKARVPLLCTLMENSRVEEAVSLVKGPLFKGFLAGGTEASKRLDIMREPQAHLAATTASYTRGALKYIKVKVLEDHLTSPENAAKEEGELVSFLQQAKAMNPFVVEYLAFSPAFDPHFPQGCDFPDLPKDAERAEALLHEALQYCAKLRQLGVWLDTDEDVRTFLRETLLEDEGEGKGEGADAGEEEPPLHPLPEQVAGESMTVQKWRRCRQEAMELWAGDLGGDAEEGEEEESGEVSESEASDDPLGRAEAKNGFG